MGNCWPFVARWCRPYAACFTALGSEFETAGRVTAARVLAIGVGVVLPICLLLRPLCKRYAPHFTAVSAAFDTTARVNAARLSAVGVVVMLPFLLLLVPLLTLRLG